MHTLLWCLFLGTLHFLFLNHLLESVFWLLVRIISQLLCLSLSGGPSFNLCKTSRWFVIVVGTGDSLHPVFLKIRVEILFGDLSLLDLGVFSHFRLFDHLLFAMYLLVCRVHLNVGIDLRSGDTFSVAIRNNIIKTEDEIKCLLVDSGFADTLGLALAHDNLLHLSDDLNIFDDV